MLKYIKQLIKVLKQECEYYGKYYELAKEKQKIILAGDVKSLDEITGREQDWIVAIGKIENVRGIIIGNILHGKNIDNVENITELAEYISEPYRTEILKMKDDLSDKVGKIQSINRLNGELIQQTLDYIHFNINMLTGTEFDSGTYGNNVDGKSMKQKRNIFDAKI